MAFPPKSGAPPPGRGGAGLVLPSTSCPQIAAFGPKPLGPRPPPPPHGGAWPDLHIGREWGGGGSWRREAPKQPRPLFGPAHLRPPIGWERGAQSPAHPPAPPPKEGAWPRGAFQQDSSLLVVRGRGRGSRRAGHVTGKNGGFGASSGEFWEIWGVGQNLRKFEANFREFDANLGILGIFKEFGKILANSGILGKFQNF